MKTTPEVLLIYPKLGFDVQDVSVELPMGYLCIAAQLLQEGFHVTILDQRVESNFNEKFETAIRRNPVFIGLTLITGRQIWHALEIAQNIREKCQEIPIVLGGVHPTLLPEQTLQNPLPDIVVRGEGEQTALELAHALNSGGDISKIKGLSYRENDKIVHTPDREFIDLNSQPDLPYHLISVSKYLMGQIPGYRRSLDVYTSRGCPCSCTYCYNQSFNKRRWRPIQTEIIIKNIRHLIDHYQIDSLFFNDDNMFVKLSRVYEICEAMEKELPFIPAWGSVGSRVDALQGCNYDILEKTGCKHLYIGIESGSDAVLGKIKKGITLDQALQVVQDLSKTKIIPHYNFMIGYPYETEEDLEATLNFIDKIISIDSRAYISSLHIITPYPGTPFYDQAIGYGWHPPDSLNDWGNIYWEKTDMPWMSAKQKRKLSNISVVSYFIDHKVADRLQGRSLFLWGFRFYSALAKYRWKNRRFNICPEFQFLKRLNEWSILE